jgi:hypothetical protein
MQDPARHQPPDDGTGTEALSRALAAHREALTAKVDLIEAERAAGHLTPVQASEQAQAARAVYDTAVALAAIERDFPRWETWVGTLPHLLYARLPMSSPPIVVRSATPQGLRAEVEATDARMRS